MIYDMAVSTVIFLYVLVAFFAFLATSSERQRSGAPALWPRFVSLVACLAWPLMAGVMFLLQKNPLRR